MQVKFLDLEKNYKSIQWDIDMAIGRVIHESAFISSSYVKNFEKQFSSYIGTKYCVGVGNGTDALEIALQAFNLSPGDEVITQANTFVATVFAITNNNLTPVLVDCDKDTCMMDISALESKITPKTKAIIPVHLYGSTANMQEIMTLAKKHNLYVIEDCAQAHGALYQNKKVGTFGDIACFSFYPGKNLGAYGDGGAILTSNDDLYKKIDLIHNLGSRVKYHHEIKGRNSRLDGLQSTILSVKLTHLDDWNEKRRKLAEYYTANLKNIPQVKLLAISPDCQSVYHLYFIQIDNRDELKKYLDDKGIGTNIHYPIPIHKLEAYKELNEQSHPVAEKLASSTLSLPMFPELTIPEIDYVIKTIQTFYNVTV